MTETRLPSLRDDQVSGTEGAHQVGGAVPTVPPQQALRTFFLYVASSRKPSGISLPFTKRRLSHRVDAKQSPLGLPAPYKHTCPHSGLRPGPLIAFCSPESTGTELHPVVHRVGNPVAHEDEELRSREWGSPDQNPGHLCLYGLSHSQSSPLKHIQKWLGHQG